MKKNLGTIDRILRVLAAIAIGILMFTGTLSGTVGTILGTIGIVLFLTGIISFCPLYAMLKLSTAKAEVPK